MIPILRVRDDEGNIIDIPAIVGPPGPRGEPGVGMDNITASDVKCADGKTVEEQIAELWQGDASMAEKIEAVGALEYVKNINPTTTGYATLLEYMASRYNDHPVICGYVSDFSDIPEAGQGVINLCGGILTITLYTRTGVHYRGTNSLTSWTSEWRTNYDSKNQPQDLTGPLKVGDRVTAVAFSQDKSGYGTPIEIGQFIDMHMPGKDTDYDGRVSIDGLGGLFFNSHTIWMSLTCASGSVNSLTDGVWRVQATVSDIPVQGACVILHKTWDDNFKVQLAICADETIRYRIMASGSWKAWKRVGIAS